MESYSTKHYHMNSNKKDSKQSCSENSYNCDSLSSNGTNSCSTRYSSPVSSSNDSGVGNVKHVRYTASGIICTGNVDSCSTNASNDQNGANGSNTGKVTSSRRGQKRSATLTKPKTAYDTGANQRNVATLAVVHNGQSRRKCSLEIQSENRWVAIDAYSDNKNNPWNNHFQTISKNFFYRFKFQSLISFIIINLYTTTKHFLNPVIPFTGHRRTFMIELMITRRGIKIVKKMAFINWQQLHYHCRMWNR